MMSLFSSNISADNENFLVNTDTKLCGIIRTNDIIDLSNIKVDIMKSDLKQVNEEVLVYENTYLYSVYTDNTGQYSFTKPSENCLVQIDLNSLPTNTGIDKQSFFIDNTNDIEDFIIGEIADVDIVDIETANVYDAYGNELITNLDVMADTQGINMYGMYDSSTLQTHITVDANGFVKEESIDIFSESVDLITKADTLYYMGAISEDERVEMYFEALKTGKYGEQECLTSFYAKLSNYVLDGNDKNLADDISLYLNGNNIARAAAQPDEVNYKTKKEKTVSNSKIKYTLNYEGDEFSKNYIDETTMNVLVGYVKDIIDYYFITHNFTTPSLQTGDSSYQIYFISGHSSNGTTKTANGGSYILINYPPSTNNTPNDIKKTIAHEIFHSIQFTLTSQKGFTGNEEWFLESSAAYAGLEYVNTYLYYGKYYANIYLDSVYKPFTDLSIDGRKYSMFLFPKYLSQCYGGISTMKRTLEYISSGYSVLDAMEKSAKDKNSAATYAELFTSFQSYNADPRKYTNSNGKYNEATRASDNANSASAVSVKSTAAKHIGFKAKSTSVKLTLTINITSGSYKNARFKIVAFPGDGSDSILSNTYTPTSSSITIVAKSFKQGTTSTNFPRITLVSTNVAKDYTNTYTFAFSRSDT